MAKKKFKPGETAPASAQYHQRNRNGTIQREVTVTRGEPLPPTPKKGWNYTISDRTNNKSGQQN